MKHSVYLSPSTQEGNLGVGDYGTEEKKMNQVADISEGVLTRHGVAVYRNKPEMNLAQVVKDSNDKKPDIHFAIHSNALNKKARGCEVFCHRYGGKGEKLARLVYAEISALTPITDRGVKEGHSHFGIGKPLYELAKTYAPAALVEIAFHDNPEDARWIVDNLEAIGTALAKAILKYFDIPYLKEHPCLEKAVLVLNQRGILDSPDYWRKNAVKGKTINGEYAATLLGRFAAYILKGGK